MSVVSTVPVVVVVSSDITTAVDVVAGVVAVAGIAVDVVDTVAAGDVVDAVVATVLSVAVMDISPAKAKVPAKQRAIITNKTFFIFDSPPLIKFIVLILEGYQ